MRCVLVFHHGSVGLDVLLSLGQEGTRNVFSRIRSSTFTHRSLVLKVNVSLLLLGLTAVSSSPLHPSLLRPLFLLLLLVFIRVLLGGGAKSDPQSEAVDSSKRFGLGFKVCVSGSDAESWETPSHSSSDKSKSSLPNRLPVVIMLLRIILECIILCVCSQSSAVRRRCAFRVTPQNKVYYRAGNVSGSEQICDRTDCCVGYYPVIDGRPRLDVLACDLAERACPEATCKAEMRYNGRLVACVCNTDFCNSNITWSQETDEQRHENQRFVDDKILTVGVFCLILLVVCFLLFIAVSWRSRFHKKNSLPPSPSCSCRAANTNEIDGVDVELQQVLSRGHFATVWQGKHQGSTVAVKVFPAGWKQEFTAEKEIHELPLMNHDGVVHFLGSGRKNDCCFIVLQYAECGSLHSFLSEHSSSWTTSLRLSQTLSQGLSFLHSDLHRHDAHKPPVAHRDVSSSNVLVKADGSCVLCDFGCSAVLRSCSGRWKGHAPNIEALVKVGSLRYMSPELLEGSVNLSSSRCLLQGDVYAVGLLLWEVWTRCSHLFEGGVAPQHLLPYESELGVKVTRDQLIQFVSHQNQRPSVPKRWELLPQGCELLELLTDCWDRDPDARLTAQCVSARLDSLQTRFPSW